MPKFLRKLTQWYFTKRALPYWCVLVLDSLCFLLTSFVYFTLKRSVLGFYASLTDWAILNVVYLVILLVCFRLFKTYVGIIRYSSFADLIKVGEANGLALIIILLMHLFFPWDIQQQVFRLSDLVILCLVCTGLMWLMRVGVKTMYDTSFSAKGAKRLFIFGVKHGGESIAKSIRNSHPKKYRIIGFISNDKNNEGHYMLGAPIFYKDENLVKQMVELDVKTLMVSPLYAEKFRKDSEFVDQLIMAGIQIMMLPPAEEWDGKSDLSYTTFKEVNVEDLLPRDQIQINMERVQEQLTGKRILITGAAGSIGSEIVRQVASFGPAELTLVDQAETPMHDVRLMMANQFPTVKAETIVTSITNPTHMEKIFQTYRPDYVFHAAAYKHVPMMENNPAQAVQNNVYGTRVIADLAVKYGTKKFVMVSTDKAVNPTNVMGCSKRICEIYVQSLDKAIKEGKVKGVTQFVTTRFGNVLGSNGSVIPLFREQIKKGGPITVTHPDIIRFFMLIPEACKLVLEAGTMGNGGEIFVFDMGQPVRIADLAKRMIKLSGAEHVQIKFTGLRDGEKLYEEVLNDAEATKPTTNPKIMVASVREYDYQDALANEKRLYEASFEYDDMNTVRIMKEIVPEFKSKHSKYEALDK